MRLLTDSFELCNEFKRLIAEYNNFYWTTAWASHLSEPFQHLINNQEKIKKLTVGIHFYQTHPDFIQEFLNHPDVRFVEQPEGTFHPKLYLFTDDSNKKWELIVGSANFTNEAFTRNTEASVIIDSSDIGAEQAFNQAINFVNQNFSDGKTFSEEDLENYKNTWKTQKQKLNSLSGQYASKTKTPIPIYKVPMTNRTWDEFMEKVLEEGNDNFKARKKVIEISQNLFNKHEHFIEFSEDERKFVAGIPNKLQIEGSEFWGYFGSMKGAGIFKNRIRENDAYISIALDRIPLSGQITKNHFDNFIHYYQKTFNGNYLSTATRLLSMKRPDTFVCFDSKNRSALCKDFEIPVSYMDYERYWNDVILRIFDSNWWRYPGIPKNADEKSVQAARAAFLDSIYYSHLN